MDFERTPSQKPKVVSVDYETVSIFCPKSNKYVTLKLVFPHEKAFEAFLQSPRTRDDATWLGGKMVGLLDDHTEMQEKGENDSLKITPFSSVDLITENFGITADEYKEVGELAWEALISGFSPKP